jgi:hypothetical protein
MGQNLDPSEMTLEDVIARLRVADPARFREVMNDLKIAGSEPNWHQMEYMDTIS